MDALVVKEDELGHGRRDSSEPLYAPALKWLTLRPVSRAYRRLPPFSQIPHLNQSQQWRLEYQIVFENETSIFGSIAKALD
jgi:hypothetical protein